MQKIIEVLNSFDPITLCELESNMLMSRFDTKFKFHRNLLPEILSEVSKDYYALDINHVRLHKYESLYFDTESYNLYLQHQNSRRNRYKVRFRHYADTNLVFFEIKQKNNKDLTIKSRIERKCVDHCIENECGDFVREHVQNLDPGMLQPKLWVNYSRITLVNKFAEERLTIDVNPVFKINGTSVAYEPLVIAEVKQGKHVRSPFLQVMKKRHIIVENISKYCMGICLLQDNIKKNNFKRNLISINKLCNEKL